MTTASGVFRTLIAAASFAAPSLSFAETPPRPPTNTEVAALMRQGDLAAENDRFADAIALWRAAYDLRSDPKNACNIGHTAARAGDTRLAAEFLARCLRDSPTPRTADEKRRLRDAADELAKVHLHVGSVTITVSHDGADVQLDGQPVGRSPLPERLFVAPGVHRITAKLADTTDELLIDLPRGSSKPATLTLRHPTQPARPAAAPAATPAPTARFTTPVPPAVTTSVPPWAYIGGIILAAGSAGAGVALTVKAVERAELSQAAVATSLAGLPAGCAVSALNRACSIYAENAESARTYRAAAAVSFVAAGAFGAATVVAYRAFGRDKKPTIEPVILANGLGVRGTW